MSNKIDQAIYTSIKSPMGSGYRLVTASAGVTNDERREIIQRSPSHGNLCDASENATGLAWFDLTGGRRCLLLVRHAGLEHSARGGHRVHTHVLLLAPALMAKFGSDPLAMAAWAHKTLDPAFVQSPPERLDEIDIASQPDFESPANLANINPADADHAAALVAALIQHRRTLLTGGPPSPDTLHAALLCVPAARRRKLSISLGLRFSPQRMCDLIALTAPAGEIERTMCDHDYAHMHWSEPQPWNDSAYAPWIRFVRQRWMSGRLAEVLDYARRLTHDVAPDVLERIAALSTEADQINIASGNRLRDLILKYAPFEPQEPLQAELLERLRQRIAKRKPELSLADQEALSAAEAGTSAPSAA